MPAGLCLLCPHEHKKDVIQQRAGGLANFNMNAVSRDPREKVDDLRSLARGERGIRSDLPD